MTIPAVSKSLQSGDKGQGRGHREQMAIAQTGLDRPPREAATNALYERRKNLSHGPRYDCPKVLPGVESCPFKKGRWWNNPRLSQQRGIATVARGREGRDTVKKVWPLTGIFTYRQFV